MSIVDGKKYEGLRIVFKMAELTGDGSDHWN